MKCVWVAGGVAAVVVPAIATVAWRCCSTGYSEPDHVHEAAQKRRSLLDSGEPCKFGVVELTDHRSIKRVAVERAEWLVLFTDGVSDLTTQGDAISACDCR